jgi:hypothetical protein
LFDVSREGRKTAVPSARLVVAVAVAVAVGARRARS